MYICCVLDGNIHIFTTIQQDGPYQISSSFVVVVAAAAAAATAAALYSVITSWAIT